MQMRMGPGCWHGTPKRREGCKVWLNAQSQRTFQCICFAFQRAPSKHVIQVGLDELITALRHCSVLLPEGVQLVLTVHQGLVSGLQLVYGSKHPTLEMSLHGAKHTKHVRMLGDRRRQPPREHILNGSHSVPIRTTTTRTAAVGILTMRGHACTAGCKDARSLMC